MSREVGAMFFFCEAAANDRNLFWRRIFLFYFTILECGVIEKWFIILTLCIILRISMSDKCESQKWQVSRI